ncbi:tRNA (adenosine(37)-N6)-threonylcarbamoyltransferase complex ATPase subunit type 1 TsaE [Bombiscardovia nodaiensis]|uniref:tRNA threonylcarbamoyladenosine biosynthesis protein TsaE n=1 Tax=Bombiscardovia nodaiensis TaxID=2932181 RepID=A0ABM8B890_9BIFI|nr:tRNA (adenosine(37)-N6)-threonylcarbamoyltransferase complex ATPase subunit type 1 TsaE [Bombiscardovia nodaiensis]
MNVAESSDEYEFSIEVDSAEQMKDLGSVLARYVRGGDVLVLSGPLGAGKTTFAQGFGRGLHIAEPIVSPTFTIARELEGRNANGQHIRLIHVDAYRLGSMDYEPGQAAADELLDQLESLGLDEELEDPGEDSVVLMEWGLQMAAALSEQRLAVSIERPLVSGHDQPGSQPELTSDGPRLMRLRAYGPSWQARLASIRTAMEA